MLTLNIVRQLNVTIYVYNKLYKLHYISRKKNKKKKKVK